MKMITSRGKSKRNKLFYVIIIALIGIFAPDSLVISKGSDDNDALAKDTSEVNTNFYDFLGYEIDIIPGIAEKEKLVKAGLLYDAEQNKIVWEKELDTPLPIASLTKMMVTLVAMEDIQANKINWDTPVTVTKEAYLIRGSKVYLRPRETYTVEQLIAYSLVASGNDACYLLAQFLGGSEKNFVYRMDNRAEELGMNNTCFSNSTGMPAIEGESDNYSSPEDLLILAKEFLKYPELLALSARPEVFVKRGYKKHAYQNHNKLVIDFEGEVDGLKTGWTNNAGCCIVTSTNKCGYRLVGIALGAQKSSIRNMFVTTLLNNYYGSIGLGKLGEKIEEEPLTTMEKFPIVTPSSAGESSFHERKYIHIVKAGENLSFIAKRYNCTPEDIKRWNGLKNYTIYVSQKLSIHLSASGNITTERSVPVENFGYHKKSSTKTTETINNIYYIIQPGDTLWNIAKRYNGVTVEQLKKINNIRDTRSLVPGKKIKIIISG